MAKLFDANGNEIEAFTEEEVKTKQKEALDAYLKEHPDQSEALTKAQKDLEEANKKITELGDGGDDGQKKRLKKERDDAESTLEKVKTELMGEITALKTSIFGTAKTKILEKLAGGDPELKKKIELEYDGFAGEVKTEADVQARLVKAFTLAKGTAPAPNFMDGVSDAGSRGVDQNHGGTVTETPNAKAQRKVFGISDEDAKKFAPKPEGQN